ncbi:hypothetical protein CAEBREN_03807 [Caenorhabditis brenneri]|uniref:Uncharacterized protein n=1 Tax=Caenorhabditis brenneri TaxID=135651 RepID=G0NF30_CAEBE|nr:hypothetical protein CAEBREN_03807 [Caenorhabditis brenneri]
MIENFIEVVISPYFASSHRIENLVIGLKNVFRSPS